MVWLPPPLCAIPTNHHHCVRCPALSAVCVCVGGGTGHSGALWWHARWCGAVLGAWPPHPPPTLSTLVASLLSPAPKPTLPHTHKWHCSLHTHMACFVCLVPSTHSHTGCLTAHTPSTHTGGCACAHPPALMRHHTHSAGTGVALAWLLWCCGHHHHAPCATHTHRDWWWAPWWWLVVGVWALCGCHATPPTRLACHHTRHIHHHTHHGVLFVWHALPLPPPPLNPITHTTTATVPQWWLPLVTTPSTHTPHLPHTPHTHQGQAQAWLWLLVWHHHHAGVGHSLSSLLPFLSTNPFLSLSCMHSHTPHPLINNTTIPSIPCVWCVLWEWTDGWTTLWLSTPHTALLMGVLIGDTIQPFHPPSPLSLCFCPPPTTTPSLFSAHHTPHRGERESGDGLVGVVGV